MKEQTCFAVVAPGIEGVAAEEAREKGFSSVEEVGGGFEFGGGLEAGMRACLHLRCPTTIRLRLGRFQARDRSALKRGLAGVDWKRWIPRDAAALVSCTARRSRLQHTGMLAEALQAAAGIDMRKGTGGLHLRLDRDLAELSLDLAGERLHLRGWRKEGGPAPLRETLAAGILRLVGWRPEEPFWDPMCGSGTLVIEAALRSLDVAPGLERSFAFERLPAMPRAAWRKMLEQARGRAQAKPRAPIGGSDRHRGAVASAERNAERAGVEQAVVFQKTDVVELCPPGAGTGALVTNPPYGARIGGGRRDVFAAYGALGRAVTERFQGWRCFALAPDDRLVEETGLAFERVRVLDNGGMSVSLFRIGR